jgi:hypothetical protein
VEWSNKTLNIVHFSVKLICQFWHKIKTKTNQTIKPTAAAEPNVKENEKSN